MKPRTILTGALLLFVAVSIGFLVVQETVGSADGASAPNPGGGPGTDDVPAVQAIPHRVIAYYFHGQKRCNTCRTIQAQSRAAIEEGFPEALIAGTLEFQEVNIEAPGNAHFVTDFDLTGSGLVLVELRDGRTVRFKNLQKVWDLVADRPAFFAYVQNETRTWLEASR